MMPDVRIDIRIFTDGSFELKEPKGREICIIEDPGALRELAKELEGKTIKKAELGQLSTYIEYNPGIMIINGKIVRIG